MRNRYYFYETVRDEFLGEHPGIVNFQDVSDILSSDSDNVYYKIPIEHRYRPDLIAQKFYNFSDLHWVITMVNGIKNSPEGYTVGTIIKIPNKERVLQAL